MANITVTFYKNTSDNNVINKKLTSQGSYTMENVTDINIFNPVFKIHKSVLGSTISESVGVSVGGGNYAYCDNTKKYYFLNYIEFKEGFVYIHFKTDVLMSFKDKILASKQLIAQSENNFNRYLNDENYKALNYNRVQFKKFPNGFTSNYKYIMLVGGGR